MLVLSRKIREFVRVRRRWLPLSGCPKDEWVLAIHKGSDLPVIAKQHRNGGGWINDDLREIDTPDAWQPIPKRGDHPQGELILSVMLADICADKVRIGFDATDEFCIHRDEVDEASRNDSHDFV